MRLASTDDDAAAFQRLVEPHRAALHAHCYRMLGSVHDAEDALQDALLRAWRARHQFEGRSALRTWLHRIATNVCLDTLSHRSRRVLPVDYGPAGDARSPGAPLGESVWVEPYPAAALPPDDVAPEARYEAREAIELAFITALQHLPGRQRAALILRDVLGFSAKEVAEMLETTTASVNSALQRARRTMEARLPTRSQQATLRSLGDARVQDLVESFIDAFERGEVEVIVALLADDATFSMPPYTGWCRGRTAVAESWLMPEGPPPRLRYVPTWANAQPAVAAYQLDRATGSYVPIALDVLTLEASTAANPRVASVIAFRTASVFAAFGLPDRIPAVFGSS
jgi:RNA polymerase sigma-70 factor, ECF subfamily